MKEGRNQGVLALEATLGKNRLDADDVRALFQYTPSLANLLCEGLTSLGLYGEVDAKRLTDLATRGLIRTADIDAALAM